MERFEEGDRVKVVQRVDSKGYRYMGYNTYVGRQGTVRLSQPYDVVMVELDGDSVSSVWHPNELTVIQRNSEITDEAVVKLWEDAIGDSGESPTTEELVEFAQAVVERFRK